MSVCEVAGSEAARTRSPKVLNSNRASKHLPPGWQKLHHFTISLLLPFLRHGSFQLGLAPWFDVLSLYLWLFAHLPPAGPAHVFFQVHSKLQLAGVLSSCHLCVML